MATDVKFPTGITLPSDRLTGLPNPSKPSTKRSKIQHSERLEGEGDFMFFEEQYWPVKGEDLLPESTKQGLADLEKMEIHGIQPSEELIRQVVASSRAENTYNHFDIRTNTADLTSEALSVGREKIEEGFVKLAIILVAMLKGLGRAGEQVAYEATRTGVQQVGLTSQAESAPTSQHDPLSETYQKQLKQKEAQEKEKYLAIIHNTQRGVDSFAKAITEAGMTQDQAKVALKLSISAGEKITANQYHASELDKTLARQRQHDQTGSEETMQTTSSSFRELDANSQAAKLANKNSDNTSAQLDAG